MWPLCSQDVLKISLINNWWYRNPPAKRQQAPAAPSHCQERGTSSCKSSRLPSDRTSSSPTNWSQLLQVLHVSFCPATSSPQHRTLPDKLLTLIFPHQQLPQNFPSRHWAEPAPLQDSQHFELALCTLVLQPRSQTCSQPPVSAFWDRETKAEFSYQVHRPKKF